jgi:hypothetical protein
MKLIWNLLALLVLVVGVIWALQGGGVVGGSFMTGQPQWLAIGAVTALIGLFSLAWVNRPRG